MRVRWTRIWFLLSMAALFGALKTTADAQGCGSCMPEQQQVVSGNITYKFDSSFPPALQDDFVTAANEWGSAFSSAGSNVWLHNTSSGEIVVSLDVGICGTAWGEARNTATAKYVKICPDALSEADSFFQRLIRHELGHIVGFRSSNCSKSESVMTEIQPGEMAGATSSLGCADVNAVAQYYEQPSCHYMPPCGQDEYLGSDGCCYQQNGSPILINLENGPVQLSSPVAGVEFDIFGTGTRFRVAWPTSRANAWLALDRDGDGAITSGRELFGDATKLSAGLTAPNGFVALSEFDANEDGKIDSSDPVFAQLRLWRDTVRDGRGAAEELTPLSADGITEIYLDYRQSARQDKHANLFRYRSKVMTTEPPVVRYAYDVFLAVVPIQ